MNNTKTYKCKDQELTITTNDDIRVKTLLSALNARITIGTSKITTPHPFASGAYSKIRSMTNEEFVLFNECFGDIIINLAKELDEKAEKRRLKELAIEEIKELYIASDEEIESKIKEIKERENNKKD